MATADKLDMDVVIFGGGAAGLWLLDELRRRGHRALLLESHALGNGQTIASQGILHGGLKYSLRGAISSSARAIRDMPAIWRECLAGRREPDLSAVRMRAEYCHLWRGESLGSRLAMIGARAGLRIAPVALPQEDRPAALAACPGTVARLDEQVIEPAGLLATLQQRNQDQVLLVESTHRMGIAVPSAGQVDALTLSHLHTGKSVRIQLRFVVLTAGQGNEQLREQFKLPAGAMQRRPLHMVMARGNLPMLNGHCVDGTATRVTITTTSDSRGRTVWQIGGRLSEIGVATQPRELCDLARRELEEVLPGIDLNGVEWATYRVDRAEGSRPGLQRPDDMTIIQEGNVVTAWPTKLVLAPRLAERIADMIGSPGEKLKVDPQELNDWPRPEVAQPPWEMSPAWFADV